MPRREFGRDILRLFFVVIWLVGISSNATIIQWRDVGETSAHQFSDEEGEEILDACSISAINFDGHGLNESVIIQTSEPTGMCVVNVTAPPGFNIALNVLETFDNVKPSYLFVEKFGLCLTSTACYDR